MQIMLAFVVGGLYAAGLYMMMRRSIAKLIIGLGLLGHAANLLILTAGRITPGRPPLVSTAHKNAGLEPACADPLPQALILTAIVIGFGVQAFAMVLIKRTYATVGTDDLDAMTTTDHG